MLVTVPNLSGGTWLSGLVSYKRFARARQIKHKRAGEKDKLEKSSFAYIVYRKESMVGFPPPILFLLLLVDVVSTFWGGSVGSSAYPGILDSAQVVEFFTRDHERG